MEPRIEPDPEATRAWVEVAQGTRLSWYSLQLITAPVAGSDFAQMDDFYPFERVFERVRTKLVAALEHLMMWADHAAPLRFHPEHVSIVYSRPPYTLARAAMESAAQAIWVLMSPEPLECSRRHLCLIRWDLAEYKRSKLDASEKLRVQNLDDDVVHRVSNVFEPKQIAPPAGHRWLLREVANAVDLNLDADRVEALWRAASGSAHGMFWPQLELHQLVKSPDGVSELRVPDAHKIAEVLEVAFAMTQYAVLRFILACGADPVTARQRSSQRLAGEITFRPDVNPDVVNRLRAGE